MDTAINATFSWHTKENTSTWIPPPSKQFKMRSEQIVFQAFPHSTNPHATSGRTKNRTYRVCRNKCSYSFHINTSSYQMLFTTARSATASKNAVFWNVAPCVFVTDGRYGGTCPLHLQGRGITRGRKIVRLWQIIVILKLVVCILLRVLGQVEGFRLTQHWFEYFIYLVTATCFGLMTIFKRKRLKMVIRPKHIAVTK
jgi:hypothetical protein